MQDQQPKVCAEASAASGGNEETKELLRGLEQEKDLILGIIELA